MIELRGDDLSASESDVTKLDISTLKAASGKECLSTSIEKIESNITNIDYVQLYWEHAAADVPIVSLGSGYSKLCMREGGGLVDPGASTGAGEGDIKLSSIIDPIAVAAGNKGSYVIKLTIRLKDK